MACKDGHGNSVGQGEKEELKLWLLMIGHKVKANIQHTPPHCLFGPSPIGEKLPVCLDLRGSYEGSYLSLKAVKIAFLSKRATKVLIPLPSRHL